MREQQRKLEVELALRNREYKEMRADFEGRVKHMSEEIAKLEGIISDDKRHIE